MALDTLLIQTLRLLEIYEHQEVEFTDVLLHFLAKCREKNSSKFKRSLKLAISSDDINNRHEVGLRKIFRRKRDVEDEEEIEGKLYSYIFDVMTKINVHKITVLTRWGEIINYYFTGDKFTAEIKFLEKWNPAMTIKDGSAYRLFQGNVLDAVSIFTHDANKKRRILLLQTIIEVYRWVKALN